MRCDVRGVSLGTHDDRAGARVGRPSRLHGVGGGADEGNGVRKEVGDQDVGAVRGNRKGYRLGTDRYRRNYGVGGGVDHGNSIRLGIRHINCIAVGSDRDRNRAAANRDSGNHAVGGGADDRYAAKALLGYIEIGPARRDRDAAKARAADGYFGRNGIVRHVEDGDVVPHFIGHVAIGLCRQGQGGGHESEGS